MSDTLDTAPIARLTVDESGLVVRSGLYAPGLPVGEHDVWCVPVSAAAELATLRAENAKLRKALAAAPEPLQLGVDQMGAICYQDEAYADWFLTARAEAVRHG